MGSKLGQFQGMTANHCVSSDICGGNSAPRHVKTKLVTEKERRVV